MQTSSGGDAMIASINITPLVDVALVLVIIFMVTLPYIMEKSLRVSASDQKAVATSSAEEPILVEISSRGLEVEGKPVGSERLEKVLRGLIAARKSSVVAVSAERGVSHGRVVKVLDQAMASGASELNLLQPKENGHGPI